MFNNKFKYLKIKINNNKLIGFILWLKTYWKIINQSMVIINL